MTGRMTDETYSRESESAEDRGDTRDYAAPADGGEKASPSYNAEELIAGMQEAQQRARATQIKAEQAQKRRAAEAEQCRERLLSYARHVLKGAPTATDDAQADDKAFGEWWAELSSADRDAVRFYLAQPEAQGPRAGAAA